MENAFSSRIFNSKKGYFEINNKLQGSILERLKIKQAALRERCQVGRIQ